MEKFNLPVHEHPLYRVGGNHIHGNYGLLLSCDGCSGEGHIDDGFRCSVCPGFYLHRKCGESALEINHPSHPQHPLKLLAGGPLCSGKRCDLCGVEILELMELLCYHCSICNFTLNIGCAINPPPLPVIKQPKAHNHPLTLMMPTDDAEFTCHICCEKRQHNKYFYLCSLCDFFFHIECVSLSREINHPCHPRHLLKFLSSGTNPSTRCSLCRRDTKLKSCYHCSICSFTLDLNCVKNPPPLTFVSPKTHKHQLTMMPRRFGFSCSACGKRGNQNPYVCAQCNFMIHANCVDLPGVIQINRHDHRISHTYDLDLLGDLDLECAVCHRTVDSVYGAYSCLKCKNFVVHSRCATQDHCWDGRDIEGEAEEIEDVAPFKVIGSNLIKHFSHEEHDMKLVKEGNVQEGTKACKACIKPISAAEFFYECIQCDYIVDERCANLPRKVQSLLIPEKATLVGGARYFHDAFCCISCGLYSSGFRYTCGIGEVDLKCISLVDRIERVAHHHPIYFFIEEPSACNACGGKAYYGYQCFKDGCKFSLHLQCATSPETVKHKSDDHTLRLCYLREDEYNQKYWCDICEKQLDYSKSKQYYACDDCGTTLHIKCVLEDMFGSISPGTIIKHPPNAHPLRQYKFEVVLNTGINRPLCSVCHSRCTFSLVLKTHNSLSRYVCSSDCLSKLCRPDH